MELILGVVVSLIVQTAKKLFGTSEYVTVATAVILAFVASLLYWFLTTAELWETVVSVLTTAGAFYTFILARFENKGLNNITMKDFK